MACDAEQARVNQLSAMVSEKASYCASICAGGQYPDECAGCRGELADLQSQLAAAQSALRKCLAGAPPEGQTQLFQLTGYLTFLRVNEPGSGFGGGSTNWFDADVIFKLDSRPDKGFGFQLRNDEFQPVRQGMLALLQDALLNNLPVTTDYLEIATTPNNNSFVIRIALQHPPMPNRNRPQAKTTPQ